MKEIDGIEKRLEACICFRYTVIQDKTQMQDMARRDREQKGMRQKTGLFMMIVLFEVWYELRKAKNRTPPFFSSPSMDHFATSGGIF